MALNISEQFRLSPTLPAGGFRQTVVFGREREERGALLSFGVSRRLELGLRYAQTDNRQWQPVIGYALQDEVGHRPSVLLGYGPLETSSTHPSPYLIANRSRLGQWGRLGFGGYVGLGRPQVEFETDEGEGARRKLRPIGGLNVLLGRQWGAGVSYDGEGFDGYLSTQVKGLTVGVIAFGMRSNTLGVFISTAQYRQASSASNAESVTNEKCRCPGKSQCSCAQGRTSAPLYRAGQEEGEDKGGAKP